MAEVFVAEKGQLTAPSKRALREAGVVVAEVSELARCQFVRASEIVSSDDMLWAALDALTTVTAYGSSAAREKFATNVLKVVTAARARDAD